MQRLQKQPRLALAECMHCIRVVSVMLRSFRQVYAASGEKTSNAVVARSPVDIVEVIGFDIEWPKGQTMPLRPPLEERIKNRFPSGRVDAPRVGQHAV